MEEIIKINLYLTFAIDSLQQGGKQINPIITNISNSTGAFTGLTAKLIGCVVLAY